MTAPYPRPMNNYIRTAKRLGVPYEKRITRKSVLKADDWTCMMEVCVYGDRKIDRDVPPLINRQIPDEYGTVDHIVPLASPGSPGHVLENVRAAHRLCNRADVARVMGFWATGDQGLLATPVPDHLVTELESIKEIVRKSIEG
jgi:hypothetical protein